jgi:sulfate permease, SulP family
MSVALVAIPQSMAYAELAGMPAQYGLFAAALPAVAAALFVSSRYLQTGPAALTALLTFGALSTLALPASTEYIGLAALLALLVGALRVVLGLLRIGQVAYLLSEPVLLGFTTGAAVLIVASQIPRLVDAHADGRGVMVDAALAVGDPAAWQWSSLGFAAATAGIVLAGRRLHRLFPGVLVAVLAAIVVSGVTGFQGATLGRLDGGFLHANLRFPWGSTPELLVPAFAIALVGFAEPASIGRTFAAEERLPWDANREMISQGVANVASALSGSFPVGGSFARSSLNRLAGATSPWAGAITGLVVTATLPLTPLLRDLPRAVLAAIVVVAVIKLIKVRDLGILIGRSRGQGVVAVATMAATIGFSPRVERGVLAGIVLALAVHLYRELSVSATSQRVGTVLTVAPQGVLWFATVPSVERVIREALADQPGLTGVRVDLGGVGRLDYTGAAELGRFAEQLADAGVDVEIVNVPPGARRAIAAHFPDRLVS